MKRTKPRYRTLSLRHRSHSFATDEFDHDRYKPMAIWVRTEPVEHSPDDSGTIQLLRLDGLRWVYETTLVPGPDTPQ